VSEFLSSRDLVDEEARRDAVHELGRAEAAGDGALAAWARKWGRAALAAIEAMTPDLDWGDDDEADD